MNTFLSPGWTSLCFPLLWAGCSNAEMATPAQMVKKFTECQSTCTNQVLAIYELFVKAPREVLDAFYQSALQTSEDPFGKWIAQLQQQDITPDASQMSVLQSLIPEPELGSYAQQLIDAFGPKELLHAPGPEVEITGTYELQSENRSGELLLSQLDNEAFRFQLTVIGGSPSHNQGLAEGEAWFADKRKGFIQLGTREAPCVIQLTFEEGQVIVETQQGNSASCGFGQGVIADGTYIRVSNIDPFLPPEAIISSNSNMLGQ